VPCPEDDAGHGSRDHRPLLDDAGAPVVSCTAAPLGTPEAARASFAGIATPDRALGLVTTVKCGLRPVLPKLGPLQEDGRQRCSYAFDNLMSEWVRISIQLPPQRCTGDSSTLRQSLDTRLPGASQGCTTGQSRARRDHPVSQVSMGKTLNVRLNRRDNQQAKAGC
jgi:hypothetical protein